MLLLLPLAGLAGLAGLAEAQVPAITPTLLFDMTLSPQDGFPTFSTGEWKSLNTTDGWAAQTLRAGQDGEAQMWMNGPCCTGVAVAGEYTALPLRFNESSPQPVRLALGTTATVNAPRGGGPIDLAAEGEWQYCTPRIDVRGVDFTLHNITISTGMVAVATEMVAVPIRSQALLDDTDTLNDFFHVTSPNGNVDWARLDGASVRFLTAPHPVTVSFEVPYSTAFFRLYGSVGPDHSNLEMRFNPPLPGVPAGASAGVDPTRSVEAYDRLLFAAPLDPHSRYTVTVPLRKGQVQALSRVDFLSGIGVGNDWPADPGALTDIEPQPGLSGHRRLSAGAIAGIVIGALAALALLAAALIYRSRRRTRANTQRWRDVKLNRLPLSPQVSPPRDVKTPLPMPGFGSGPSSPVSPPQRAHHYPPTADDLQAEPRTPWPWAERPQV